MTTRGNGRIYARPGSPFWWASYYAQGKEQREVAKHVRTGEKLEAIEEKRHEAERYLKHRLGQVTAEAHGGPSFVTPTAQRVTVGELLDTLQARFELDGKWTKRTKSSFKMAHEHFGLYRAAALTSAQVSAFQLALREKEYQPATVNRYCQVIGQAYNLGIEDKRVSAKPAIKRLSEIGNEREGFFETAEFEAVLSHLPEYLHDFSRFAFMTGKRKGSIASMRWIDVTDGVIYFGARNVKTRKAESVPVDGEVKELIDRCRAKAIWEKDGQSRFSEYVFHREGQPIGDFRKAWATACIAAGVGKLVCPECEGDVDENHQCAQCSKSWSREDLKYVGRTFHDLRRTASRNMIRAGVPQSVAMRITGHRTDSIFRRYAITDEEQKREALNKTDAYLRQQEQKKIAVMPRR